MTTNNARDGRWRADEEIVDRLIRADWEYIRSRLTDPSSLVDVPMHFDEHFERVDRIVEIWRASGRIERLGRLERVEIEVSKASAVSADLRVLPWKQRPRFRIPRKRHNWLIEIADHLESAVTGKVVEIIDVRTYDDDVAIELAPDGATA